MASTWAIAQISRLLPLDEESLKQILEYSSNLPKDAAAEHLRDILGSSAQALEFIASYNARRDAPSATSVMVAATPSNIPTSHRPRKKKAPLNNLPPPRRPEDYGNTSGAYQKKAEQEYMPGSQILRKDNPLANTLSLTPNPTTIQHQIPKAPPSAAGTLISSLPNVRTSSRPSSHPSSRSSSPLPKTTIPLSGGTPMHGASTSLIDLDSAIRALELQTNPSFASSDTSSRRCDCQASRHPLLAAAPNCLACGKIVCVKEGLGPCTFCDTPLLSQSDIQGMVRALRDERGREKTDAHNAVQRRADVAKAPRPFQSPLNSKNSGSNNRPTANPADATLLAAKQHRDKLLTYQAQNAQRTQVHDEAADFDTPAAGQSMWSSPVERAAQLKRQQKVLREQEWAARPEWEKRRVVVSVDLVGGKVVRRMGRVEREDEAEGEDEGVGVEEGGKEGQGTGAFGRNPLLGGLVRPVWKGKGDGEGGGAKVKREKAPAWRRVQDDSEDNEALILDGGVYGGRPEERILGYEERAVG